MYYVIVGGQRQGKTNLCAKKMKSYLINTDRHIYTNLPINPDIIAKQITKSESNNPINFHEEMKEIIERIHIIRRFPDWEELRKFRNKNPLFCAMHKWRERTKDFEYDKTIIDDEERMKNRKLIMPVDHNRIFFPIDCIYRFWDYKRYNSVIMFDEIYNYFPTISYVKKTEEVQEKRFALLNYVLQHGHDKDDLYFITHDIDLIDKNILVSIQYTYKCYNSLHRNMIPADVLKRYDKLIGWMRGLKNLYMYFIVEGYDKDNNTKEPSDFWQFRADKELFLCFESFSKREGSKHKIILNKVADKASASSSDINKSKFQILKEFAVQAWPQILIMICIIMFIFFVYRQVYKLIYKGRQTEVNKVVKKEESVPSESRKEDKKIVRKKVKISGITPNCIFYDDGYRIEKGSVYEGLIVADIGRTFCVFECNGKTYRVTTNSIRTETDIEPDKK